MEKEKPIDTQSTAICITMNSTSQRRKMVEVSFIGSLEVLRNGIIPIWIQVAMSRKQRKEPGDYLRAFGPQYVALFLALGHRVAHKAPLIFFFLSHFASKLVPRVMRRVDRVPPSALRLTTTQNKFYDSKIAVAYILNRVILRVKKYLIRYARPVPQT